MIRVADYIMEYLANYGIAHAFTVTGGGSIFLCDALAQNQKIKTIFCHHEQATAMAAEAYARVRGSVGFTLVTCGPGATNAVTGAAGSYMDSVPHLIISGQVFLAQTTGETGLRQLGVQEIDVIKIVHSISKYAVMVTDAQEIRYHLEKALYLATHGRPGPVWLDLPADIQNAKVDPSTLRGFTPPEVQRQVTSDVKEAVRRIVEKLKGASKPLIHVGQGVKLAGAEALFFKFIEKHQIPFVTARNANDIVASDHPLFVGRPGTYPQRGANFSIQNCDLYLAVGTRLSLPQTGFNTQDFARSAYKVMVDIDPAELAKKTLPMDLTICSDAKLFLEELITQGAELGSAPNNWLTHCRSLQNKYPPVTTAQRNQEKLINSYYLVELLSELLGSDDVIVTDMGASFQGTHQAFAVKKGQKLFTNCGFASMGWGLPAAIGACFAHGMKRTICLSGEGGLMMNVQELATVMHHKLPIKLFILNNGGYLTIRQTQQVGFGGRLFGIDADSGISFPDFIQLAKAYHLPVIRLDSHKGLREKVSAVLESSGPMVCEIMMDQDQDQCPRSINRRNPDGSLQKATYEDLYPFLDPEEVAANLLVK